MFQTMNCFSTQWKYAIQLMLVALFAATTANAQETIVKYLSGTDKEHTVNWNFYCTDGRNSGQWTTIPVPSNWELQGFGTYNYGLDPDSIRGKEKGIYRYSFNVPKDWKKKQINIVFEGSMTDTEVKINGQSAGPVHQGAFYQFKYNITRLLKFGSENQLEVTVSKHSTNESVNEAERHADYWIFGGIFRPVYLEALPQQHIVRTTIDAKQNGNFTANVYLSDVKNGDEITAQILNSANQPVDEAFSVPVTKGKSDVRLTTHLENPKPWTPEFPNLYKVVFELNKNQEVIHRVEQKFGFRTVELRPHDGIYVNGIKVKFKGVNRHSFWPNSGRTTSKKLSIRDVKLMKQMNMNAVRMSHYPPDPHFLDVCDSLGLFVLDELAGWQSAYDTQVGTKLVEEMVNRDVNHPSIVIWDNGNEGGWNTALDNLFLIFDPQHRPVIHPGQLFQHTDNRHYIDYDYGAGTFFHGNEIFFPTEFLHGLYDGGAGAGLEDYWNLLWHNPLSAGGFIWDFSDEAVVRTDKDNELDTDGSHAADGILGPYREKEASFYSIREIWSPVFFEKRIITPQFNGQFHIENRYSYTNLSQCKVDWKWVKLPPVTGGMQETIASGEKEMPAISPGNNGVLSIDVPGNFHKADVLYLTVIDPHGKKINTWSWPVKTPAEITAAMLPPEGKQLINVDEKDTILEVTSGKMEFEFSKTTGYLGKVISDGTEIPFNDGPILSGPKPTFKSVSYHPTEDGMVIEAKYANRFRELKWTVMKNGLLKLESSFYPPHESNFMGISFYFPEDRVTGMTWMGYGPYRVWKNRMKGNTLAVWHSSYNNTITGETYQYPEFKGYHKDFYWASIETTNKDFSILCASPDIFLRMFTPEPPHGAFNDNTAPAFPKGNISFMHAISPIGTKFKKPEQLGPMGQPSKFDNQRHEYFKSLILYFDFR
ncbi:beta galactosidase small subunit [Prolixibacter denitrificans]|uniref:beta-galactosidase n=3 Tax=Prolixibacter denitrificans TaxID=1541063 RepID=A0A2P8CFP4_9BACT|nr:beta galactosidase small subunit [Prolixibacter denitrificans]